MFFAWIGYQAEDAEMVTVSSPSVDAEAELLYPSGLDISLAALLAAGSMSGNDTHIVDDSTSMTLAANIQQSLTDADRCDNNLQQSSVAELAENGE